jgi:hypothetical protein
VVPELRDQVRDILAQPPKRLSTERNEAVLPSTVGPIPGQEVPGIPQVDNRAIPDMELVMEHEEDVPADFRSGRADAGPRLQLSRKGVARWRM